MLLHSHLFAFIFSWFFAVVNDMDKCYHRNIYLILKKQYAAVKLKNMSAFS
ncbi:hypothetical protein CAMSH0001_0222 [Campylobacter showae RM3277]|uniref:Uncharacterized protein n=1 Tax=Campylobacter showae RM3277 TaxID=553219 RepID=C6RI70_9BACT|nr:hypothetical protein CAMSH0001_0222 [Campylobacter showae RM3277]